MFTEIFIFLYKHRKQKIKSPTHRVGIIFFAIILFLFLKIYYSCVLCQCILLSFVSGWYG